MKSPFDTLLLPKLQCPQCSVGAMDVQTSEQLRCAHCGHRCAQYAGVWDLAEITDRSQQDIVAFWGDLYKQLYEDSDMALERSRLYGLLDDLESQFKHHRQPIGTDVSLEDVRGKDVLEIGCGAGAHSSLMKRAGAHMVSVDITPERALATQKKLSLLDEGAGIAVRANAERLPFRDRTFDIVYSFGVLHHTTYPEQALAEVYRVLRPGGSAIIMLYCRISFFYLVFFLKAMTYGYWFQRREGSNWLGRVTEGEPKYGQTYNPFTRCYTKRELQHMFTQYRSLVIRKNGFSINQVPWIGWRFERWLVAKGLCRTSSGGWLIWNEPTRLKTRLEMKLGEWVGFDYDIVATK